jgi:hypothetical protein
MTAPVSAVPAARTYLIAAINTSLASSPFTEPGVEVFNGAPDDQTPNDQIIVGEVRREGEAGAIVGSGGAHWRREKFHVSITIESFVSGVNDAMAAVDLRAHALLSLVESAVRADPSLGGLALVAYPTHSDSSYHWEKEHKGAFCQISLSIFVHAEQ